MNNDLSKVAELTKHQPFGLKTVGSDGKVTKILPDKDDMLIDVSKFETKPQTVDKPSAGFDFYAGSLANGEITDRNLLWKGETTPNEISNLKLLRDVGSKFNIAGEGIFVLMHLEKSLITRGVKENPIIIPLNYDVENKAKDGYFTTTSPYPIYIKAEDLATKEKLTIPIKGIGEGFNYPNNKEVTVSFTFNEDRTIDVETTTGFSNDGLESEGTGVIYDAVVEIISTYSTQKAVYQVPPTINLFSGLATDNIALAGAGNFYETVMDGIEIQLDNYARHPTKDIMVYSKQIGIKNRTIRIPKEQLILDNSFKILEDRELPVPGSIVYDHSGNQLGAVYSGTNVGECIITVYSNYFNISIPVTLGAVTDKNGQEKTVGIIYVNVIKVTPYKN